MITVNKLSKKYSKAPDAEKSKLFIEFLKAFFLGIKSTECNKKDFWVFKDLCFKVKKGEVFAILGSNGSGKSTLLKVIYGLTSMTKGEVKINGRMDALINLGAGFNRDISGRENIKNYAALHHYPTNKVNDLVNQIIEFSELKEFIDSPVKTYSSGMYARLGFSLITHMNPDILIIDEVLAVGDVSFQNKCFVKMQELKKRGVTFVIVSHNQAQIAQFCDRALWIEKGKFMDWGEADMVLKKYLQFMNEKNSVINEKVKKTKSKQSLYGPIHNFDDQIRGVKVKILNKEGNNKIIIGEDVFIEYEFELLKSVDNLNVSLNFSQENGTHMSTINTINGNLLQSIKNGKVKCKVKIENLNFNPGIFVLVIVIQDSHRYLYRNIVQKFSIIPSNQLVWGQVNLRYKYEIL